MALEMAVQPTESHQLLCGEVSRLGQGGVQDGGSVPLAEEKTVSVWPVGIGGVVPDDVEVETGNDIGR
jgi:hypothetical protein